MNTTNGRKIFPKGKVIPGDSLHATALRYAQEEGGINGKAVSNDNGSFIYFKEDEGREQIIATIIIEYHGDTKVLASFRKPRWYTKDKAITALSDKRPVKYREELRKVIDFAEEKLKQNLLPRIQSGVVPYRIVDGSIEIMMITSRVRRAWILPKGNIATGISSRESAKKEAREESGVEGAIGKNVIGKYKYERMGVEYHVEMFPMKVENELSEYMEMQERRRKWFSINEAINEAEYDEVKQVIMDFSNKFLQKSSQNK